MGHALTACEEKIIKYMVKSNQNFSEFRENTLQIWLIWYTISNYILYWQHKEHNIIC